MGLDISLWDGAGDARGDVPSERWPEHLCNRRYLRSSYNAGGFNQVVGNLIGVTLYEIFGYRFDGDGVEGTVPYDEDTDEGGYWEPSKAHLEAALVRANAVRDQLNVAAPLAVEALRPAWNLHEEGPKNANQAMAVALEKLNADASFDSFSCREGTFFTKEPMTVKAVVYGATEFYVVHETDLTFYRQMADVIVEFIEDALAMTCPRISWSG